MKRLVAVAQCAGQILADDAARQAAVAVGHGHTRIELDRLAVVGDGLAEFPLVVVHDASAVKGECLFGIEFDGFLKGGFSLVEIRLQCIDAALHHPGSGQGGFLGNARLHSRNRGGRSVIAAASVAMWR